MKRAALQVVRGSGTVFRDFGQEDANLKQLKAIFSLRPMVADEGGEFSGVLL